MAARTPRERALPRRRVGDDAYVRLGDGRLLVNPGSPTDRRRERRYSWALLEVGQGIARAELRFFDDRRP